MMVADSSVSVALVTFGKFGSLLQILQIPAYQRFRRDFPRRPRSWVKAGVPVDGPKTRPFDPFPEVWASAASPANFAETAPFLPAFRLEPRQKWEAAFFATSVSLIRHLRGDGRRRRSFARLDSDCWRISFPTRTEAKAADSLAAHPQLSFALGWTTNGAGRSPNRCRAKNPSAIARASQQFGKYCDRPRSPS